MNRIIIQILIEQKISNSINILRKTTPQVSTAFLEIEGAKAEVKEWGNPEVFQIKEVLVDNIRAEGRFTLIYTSALCIIVGKMTFIN